MLVGLAEISAGELLLDGEPATDWAPAERDLAHRRSRTTRRTRTCRCGTTSPSRCGWRGRRRTTSAAGSRTSPRELELTDAPEPVAEPALRRAAAAGRARPGAGPPAGRRTCSTSRCPLQDPPVRSRLLGLIQRDTGTTTLYVTHDQGEAMALGGRVAVLWHGALEQVGHARGGVRAPGEPRRRRPASAPPAGEPAARHGGRRRPAAADGGRAAGRVRPGPPRRARPGAGRRYGPSTSVDAALVPGDGASHGVVFAAPGRRRRSGPARSWSPGCATAATARCRPPSPRCGRSSSTGGEAGVRSPGSARAARRGTGRWRGCGWTAGGSCCSTRTPAPRSARPSHRCPTTTPQPSDGSPDQ